jgi:hypothetical protein
MMDWLTYAADLNRKGSALLEAHDHEYALECFQEALAIVSLLLSTLDNDEKGGSFGSSTSLVHALPNPLPLASGNPCMPTTPKLPCHPNDKNHFIFEKALNFPSNSGVMINANLLSHYSAVIAFNLALSLHLLSRRWGEKPLNSALVFYDHCLELLGRFSTSGSSCSGMGSWKLLLFAALNNKAVVLYDLCHFQRANDALALLSDAIKTCRMTSVLHTIDDNDMEGFLFNLMLLVGGCGAPAA